MSKVFKKKYFVNTQVSLEVCDNRGQYAKCASAFATITIKRNSNSPTFLDNYFQLIDRFTQAGTFVIDTDASDSDLRVCNH
jgi:hypothetical protein